ncbi:acyltransferase family protein [Puniceibacterium sp. IMCC21224]|uniref:acyltransferase family protein n=1 Tax=Puniceibacterium sp. IMCC21224 TaxID=1618204 RepID=UPI00065D29D5|nr:acyltransferase family protein [Puniceibacterium sp. IMCC21224]KMK63844.1 hypothetical protein IMCC21224_1831 [Puniceibacterium sp. IMCC21224]
MAGQRLRWMDLVRGVCILLVILVHAEGVVKGQGLYIPAAINVFNEFLDPFRMPLLMFLSGMMLEKSLSKNNRDYVLGKFHLIFWPFLIWSMIVYAAEGRLTLEYILKTPISAPSLLWYLWFLCAYYLIALLLERCRVPLIPVMFICLIASGFLPSLLRMDRFAALLIFFLLGHYIVRNKVSLQNHAYLALLGLGAALTGGLMSVLYGPIKYNPLFIWAPVGLILFVLWAAPLYRSTQSGQGIEWIGRNSIVFYVGHFPLLLLVAGIMRETTALDGVSFYAILLVATLAINACLQLLRSRYDIVAALFDFRKLPSGLRFNNI